MLNCVAPIFDSRGTKPRQFTLSLSQASDAHRGVASVLHGDLARDVARKAYQ